MRAQHNEDYTLTWQGNIAVFLGQLSKGRDFYNRSANAEIARNSTLHAGQIISSNAWRSAVFGKCREALGDYARSSTFPPNAHSSLRFGIVQALCGDVSRARSLADQDAGRFPEGTWVNAIEVPILRAAIEIRRGNPELAIQFLVPAKQYDGAGFGSVVHWPQYLRGQAYLALHQGPEAAIEFQKILDQRGLGSAEPLYPLAYVGLARAAVLMGDTAKARKTYEDFLALWKDADPDIPILNKARREYERLKLPR